MNKQEVYDFIKSKNIWYEITEHKPVFNMDDLYALNLPYPDRDAKNIFIRDDKKQKYYLITVKGNKKVDLKEFRKKNNTRPLSFAVTGGHVSFKDNGFKTCKKETYEEIGLELNDNEIKYVDTFDIKNCFVEIYYINKDVNINELKLQKSEVGNVYWMNEDEINDLINNNLFRESNIQPFKRVVEYIKNKYNVL